MTKRFWHRRDIFTTREYMLKGVHVVMQHNLHLLLPSDFNEGLYLSWKRQEEAAGRSKGREDVLMSPGEKPREK